MKKMVVAALLATFSLEVQAVTWDFDENDNAQGWLAQESFVQSRATASSLRSLPSEVREGVWHVSLPSFETARNPGVTLVFPQIGYPSELFDRVSLRLRVTHSRPIQGNAAIAWTNPLNRNDLLDSFIDPDYPDGRLLFSTFPEHLLYTTDWQEITVDIRPGSFTVPTGDGELHYRTVWEGELSMVWIDIGLYEPTEDRPFIEGPEEMPEAVEIDRIVLTGFEEQLQGELPPPDLIETPASGSLFTSEANFIPLANRGVGDLPLSRSNVGAMGDLDGDGDVDLVVLVLQGDSYGWLAALNDGKGSFKPDINTLLEEPRIPFLDGADLDGDGQMEVVVGYGTNIRILRYEEGHWTLVQEINEGYIKGLGDADGDGNAEIWVAKYTDGEVDNQVFDGSLGQFDKLLSLNLDSPEKGADPQILVYPVSQKQVSGMLWSPPTLSQGYEVIYLEDGEAVQKHLAFDVDPRQILYAGDLDADGDVDLMVSDGRHNELVPVHIGLSILLNKGDGDLERIGWYPDARILHRVQAYDLNGDRIPDPVFIDSDVSQPAVVVNLGRSHEMPVQEGRYPIEGQLSTILGGDVDGDGDTDLAILDRASSDGGGVHVLTNLYEQETTAVEESVGRMPSRFDLVAAYPNPFNPGLVIPFTLGTAAEFGNLTIFNSLGQEVRRVALGELTAGVHQVMWDGQDAQGKVLSSGVYIYRLQAGGWRAAGKMVKSE